MLASPYSRAKALAALTQRESCEPESRCHRASSPSPRVTPSGAVHLGGGKSGGSASEEERVGVARSRINDGETEGCLRAGEGGRVID